MFRHQTKIKMKVLHRIQVQAQLTHIDKYGKYQYFVDDQKSKTLLTNMLNKLDKEWAQKSLFQSEKSDRLYFKLKADLADEQKAKCLVDAMHMMKPTYIDICSYEWEGETGYTMRLFALPA